MSLLDAALAKIAPHNCLSCGEEGSLLCMPCLAKLPGLPDRCYRCHDPSPDSLTCATCLQASLLVRVKPGTVYVGVAKTLIWRIKSSGAQEAARIMASRLAPLIRSRDNVLIVPVPTASSRVRQRGYDQSQLLARQLARQTGGPWFGCLVRVGQAHQVGANREQRKVQLRTAFRVRRPSLLRGKHLLLVDDVVTTGATLEAAAKVLIEAGAARVEALTFAQPLTHTIK